MPLLPAIHGNTPTRYRRAGSGPESSPLLATCIESPPVAVADPRSPCAGDHGHAQNLQDMTRDNPPSTHDRDGSGPPPFLPLSGYGNATLAEVADDVAAAVRRWTAATHDVLAALRRQQGGAASAGVSALRQILELAAHKLAVVVAGESETAGATDAYKHARVNSTAVTQGATRSENLSGELVLTMSRRATKEVLERTTSFRRVRRENAEVICPKNDTDWAWLSNWASPTLYVTFCVCAHVCMCVCMCVCMRVYMGTCVCMSACVYSCASVISAETRILHTNEH